jgi:hypothetical protein
MGISNKQKQENYRARKRWLEDEVRRLTGLVGTAGTAAVDDAEAAEDRKLAESHPDRWPDMPVSEIKNIRELRNYIEKALRRGVSPDVHVDYCDQNGDFLTIKCCFVEGGESGDPPVMVIDYIDERPERPEEAAVQSDPEILVAKDREIAELKAETVKLKVSITKHVGENVRLEHKITEKAEEINQLKARIAKLEESNPDRPEEVAIPYQQLINARRAAFKKENGRPCRDHEEWFKLYPVNERKAWEKYLLLEIRVHKSTNKHERSAAIGARNKILAKMNATTKDAPVKILRELKSQGL